MSTCSGDLGIRTTILAHHGAAEPVQQMRVGPAGPAVLEEAAD